MVTLQEVLDHWNATYKPELNIDLEFPPTNERQRFVGLEDSDAEITAQRIEIIVDCLRQYPKSFLTLNPKTTLSILRMVKGGTFWGRGGGRLMVFGAVPLNNVAKVVHHEMMHILDISDGSWGQPSNPHPEWINREGWTYGAKDPDRTGFVSHYAQTAYREDLADTAAYIWVYQDLMSKMIVEDPLVAGKCRAIVKWWSKYGLTRFNESYGVPMPEEKVIVMTERISGASRFETAVKVSQTRFVDGADVVYLAASNDFPDALVASTLATDGPLLLVPIGSTPRVVLDEVARLRPSRVVAVGGPSAVSEETLEAVREAAQL